MNVEKIFLSKFNMGLSGNKRVLLHDRKRHTARRVAGTRSAVLSLGWGVPQSQPDSTPILSGVERTRNQRSGKESGTGVPPWRGPGTRDQGKNLGLGAQPWTDRHLCKQYLPHLSDASGNWSTN